MAGRNLFRSNKCRHHEGPVQLSSEVNVVMILGNTILLKATALTSDSNIRNLSCCPVERAGNKDIGSHCPDLNLNVNEPNNQNKINFLTCSEIRRGLNKVIQLCVYINKEFVF